MKHFQLHKRNTKTWVLINVLGFILLFVVSSQRWWERTKHIRKLLRIILKKKVLEAGRGAAESTLRKRSAVSWSYTQARSHSRHRHRTVQRQQRLCASQFRRNPAKNQPQQRNGTFQISEFLRMRTKESSWFKINLVNKDCRRGTEVEVGLENEEARTLDLMADFMDEIDVRAILLHAEAIDDESDWKRSKKEV